MEQKRILVVDDDLNVLKSLRVVLQLEGYHVDSAETAAEALEKYETNFYNLALLDIRLPDMEGTELLTRMHRDKPQMMKIMITGYPSQENAVKALNRGADAYILKPVEAEDLAKVAKEKLREQEEAEKMSQEKVTEWIKTRIKKLEKKSI